MKVKVNAGRIGSQYNADLINVGGGPNEGPARGEAVGELPEAARLEVFVSHSSGDSPLAQALSDLLVRALRLDASDVRCSSVDGHRLAAGANVSDTLRANIRGARAFVAILTPRALASPYVLFELGARWGQETPFFPVRTSELEASALKPPLSELNVLHLAESAQVQQLVFDLGRLLARALEPPHSYAQQVAQVSGLAGVR